MSTGHEREFSVVDLVMNHGGATAGVDSFALAIIKTERQMRRLLTFAVFQSSAFDNKDIPALRRALVTQDKIYFDQLRSGFETLSNLSLAELLGDRVVAYEEDLKRVRRYRNKLFHGQLTDASLSTRRLNMLTRELSESSRLLGQACLDRFGYSGYDASYVKGKSVALTQRATELLPDHDAYRTMLRALQPHGGQAGKAAAAAVAVQT